MNKDIIFHFISFLEESEKLRFAACNLSIYNCILNLPNKPLLLKFNKNIMANIYKNFTIFSEIIKEGVNLGYHYSVDDIQQWCICDHICKNTCTACKLSHIINKKNIVCKKMFDQNFKILKNNLKNYFCNHELVLINNIHISNNLQKKFNYNVDIYGSTFFTPDLTNKNNKINIQNINVNIGYVNFIKWCYNNELLKS